MANPAQLNGGLPSLLPNTASGPLLQSKTSGRNTNTPSQHTVVFQGHPQLQQQPQQKIQQQTQQQPQQVQQFSQQPPPQHQARVETQAHPWSHVATSNNTAPLTPPNSDSVAPESYGRPIPIPGLKGIFIYPDAKVALGRWTAQEYDARFKFVSEELRKTVNENPELRDRADHIDYRLHMVGSPQEKPKPKIIVYCCGEDFNKLRFLFRTVKGPLYCKTTSKIYRLLHKTDPNTSRVPPLGLVYFRPRTTPKTKTARDGDAQQLGEPGNSTTWCGVLVHHGSRTATLGLALQVRDAFSVTTSDHLFEPEGPDDTELVPISNSIFVDVDASSDSTLNDDEMEDLGALWDDEDMEYLDEYEDDICGEWGEPERSRQDTAAGSHLSGPLSPEEFLVDRIQPPRQLAPWEAYLDWSLAKPATKQSFQPLPNIYYPSGIQGEAVTLGKIASAPRYHRVPVHIVSGIRGVLSGRLLGGTAMLGSGPDKDLCEAWIVSLESNEGVVAGESGSLVIDQETHEVYGHVIASDPCGYAYVVPMTNIWRQIETRFGQGSVRIFRPETSTTSASDQGWKSVDYSSYPFQEPSTLVLAPEGAKAVVPDDLFNPMSIASPRHVAQCDIDPDVAHLPRPSSSSRDQTHNTENQAVPNISEPGPEIVYSDYEASSSDDDSSTMQNALTDAMVRTEWGASEFLPSTALSSIVKPTTVYEELARNEKVTKKRAREQIREIASLICRNEASFRKVFAILVLIERPDYIFKMVDRGVTDDYLPLVSTSWGEYEFSAVGQPDLNMAFIRRWPSFVKARFQRTQWSLLAPTFCRGDSENPVRHYALLDEQVLPFLTGSRGLRDDQTTRASSLKLSREVAGGFGSVSKVEIHPDHHEFASTTHSSYPGNWFALKKLRSQSKDEFELEAEALKFATKLSNAHLLSVLATYQHRNHYYFILPWAETNLHEYWISLNPKPQYDVTTMQWYLEQFSGLVSGLAALHRGQISADNLAEHEDASRLFYIHGDIKPQNILFFRNETGVAIGGKLVLGDFGLSRVHEHNTASRPASDIMAATWTYAAPELALGVGATSRSVDIFSLGCVFLEFVTWFLMGVNALDDFAEERSAVEDLYGLQTDTFYEVWKEDKTTSTALKAGVKAWIERLHTHPQATEVIQDLLDTIEFDMLKIEPTERITSWKLSERLRNLADKSVDDHDYCIRPCPRGPKIPEPRTKYSVSESVKDRATPGSAMRRRQNRTVRIYSERKSKVRFVAGS